MFEDSTFESNGRIRTRSRGWMLATFVLNSSILLALVLFPLLHTQALQYRDPISPIELPPTTSAPPTPPHALERVASNSPTAEVDPFTVPTLIPILISMRPDPMPPGITANVPMDSGPAIPGGFGDGPHGPPAPRVIQLAPKGPVHVTSQIASGLLIRKVLPQYPALARTVHVQGTVVLAATIAKDGTIANLRVVSGPTMLQQAALEAVSQWRYKPYLLNGEPVDVETSVNVIFTLGN
jgi:protein TonB